MFVQPGIDPCFLADVARRCARPVQIWVISRHYSDDVHMSGLLESIAGCIQARPGCFRCWVCMLRAALLPLRLPAWQLAATASPSNPLTSPACRSGGWTGRWTSPPCLLHQQQSRCRWCARAAWWQRAGRRTIWPCGSGWRPRATPRAGSSAAHCCLKRPTTRQRWVQGGELDVCVQNSSRQLFSAAAPALLRA